MSESKSGTGSGTERYSVPQAARKLGISERAIRKRIKAGTLTAEREGRHWVVWLPSEPESGTSTADSGTSAEPGGTDSENDQTALVDQLRAENDRLWAELEKRNDDLVASREAERELRIIVARLTERIPELPERTESRQGDDKPHNDESAYESAGETQSEPERSWWKFWEW
jgi:excisionase family DNA binding protein